MKNKCALIIAIVALAGSLAACNPSTNDNVATTNANLRPINANVTPTPAANTNANSNRSLTREDYERDKEKYQREAKQSGRSVGTGLNDGWLWVKTRFDLAAADDLRDSTINVDLNNEVVTLTGTVASAEQKAKAEAVAKSVEGVKAVKNMLKVAPNTNSNTTKTNTNSNVRKK